MDRLTTAHLLGLGFVFALVLAYGLTMAAATGALP